jgi:hypothetical protein
MYHKYSLLDCIAWGALIHSVVFSVLVQAIVGGSSSGMRIRHNTVIMFRKHITILIFATELRLILLQINRNIDEFEDYLV